MSLGDRRELAQRQLVTYAKVGWAFAALGWLVYFVVGGSAIVPAIFLTCIAVALSISVLVAWSNT